MANEFGPRTPILNFPSVSGRPIGVIAGNADRTRWKVGGVTIDWATVAPALTDTTEALSGDKTLTGQKILRFGTVLCKLASGKYGPYSRAMTSTTLNGAVLAGATSIVLTSATNVYPGDTLHIAAGGGTAEDVVVQSVATNTVTLQSALGFGHADTTVVTEVDDGRQTIKRGESFILNKTIIKGQALDDTIVGEVFDGGCTCYLERIASDYGSSGLAANPTRTVLESGFPTLTWLI